MIQYIFLVPFFVILGILLVDEVKENDNIRYFCMATLMPLLLLYYVFSVPLGKIDWLIIIALIFGYLGDLFLMFRNEKLFIFGLAAFLFGHILYIIAFLISITNIAAFPIWGIVFFLPSALIALFALNRLVGKLGELAVPTYIYMMVIVTMGFCAILRLAEFDLTSFLLVWLGANLFMLSDSMIAIKKFDKDFPYSEIFIKLTYVLAQFFIVQGIILGVI